MASQTHKSCLLLLLIVLLSHASLTLHINSHVAADQQACEICTHYSNLEHAPAPSVAASFPAVVYVAEIFTDAARSPAFEAAPCRQRAPPHAA